MRWKDIKEDASATAAAPAGWAQELDRGIAEAMTGPTFSFSEVIADLDDDLAKMAKKESDIGHGETRPTDATTNQRASSRLRKEKPSGSYPESEKRASQGSNSRR